MTVCVHHIASIEARNDPETHWIEVDFIDRLGQATKMHWYTLREDSAAEQAFAAEITAALNALSKFRPDVLSIVESGRNIVERLRYHTATLDRPLCTEAAVEIERLRAENVELAKENIQLRLAVDGYARSGVDQS